MTRLRVLCAVRWCVGSFVFILSGFHPSAQPKQDPSAWNISADFNSGDETPTVTATLHVPVVETPYSYVLTLRCGLSPKVQIGTYQHSRIGARTGLEWLARPLRIDPDLLNTIAIEYRVDDLPARRAMLSFDGDSNVVDATALLAERAGAVQANGVHSALASAKTVTVPERTLTVAAFFPDETVVFPFDILAPTQRETLRSACSSH